MVYARLRRHAIAFGFAFCAVILAGCDMSMLAYSGKKDTAQKQRMEAAPRRTAAVPARDYRLGSGDKLGAASFAIYCDETILAGPVDR